MHSMYIVKVEIKRYVGIKDLINWLKNTIYLI